MYVYICTYIYIYIYIYILGKWLSPLHMKNQHQVVRGKFYLNPTSIYPRLVHPLTSYRDKKTNKIKNPQQVRTDLRRYLSVEVYFLVWFTFYK